MSNTWRGTRRRKGVRKTRDHIERGRWSGLNNGARLRSLKVDLQDFERGVAELRQRGRSS